MSAQTQEAERTLPHSHDAERAILGAVLVDAKAWSVAALSVSAGDFFRDAHRRIFEALGRLAAAGVAPDFVTLKEELLRAGDLDECGGAVYVSSLADGFPSSTNVRHYAGIVREKAQLRAAIYAANVVATEAYEASDRSADIVARGSRALSGVVRATADGMVGSDEAVRQYVALLDDDAALARIPTGHADIDALLTGGMRRGDLFIVAARPSVGKTAFVLGVADHVARTSGAQFVFFSLEMSQDSMAARLLSMRAHVQSARLEQRMATSAEYGRVATAIADISPRLRIECHSRTVAEIFAWCRKAQEDGPIAGVAVDYLQLLVPERSRASSEAEVSEISRDLKKLAKDLAVPVVALSQLSRAPEARRDKRPSLADLRGSGALEQDADVALLLFREEMHSQDADVSGIAEAIVAKSRNGPTGVVRLAFLRDYTLFADLANQ